MWSMTKDIYKGCRPYGASMDGLSVGIRGFAPTANMFCPYGATMEGLSVGVRGLAPTATICRSYAAIVKNND